MLRELRGPSGGPNLRVRLLALLVVLGTLFLAAPVVLIPLAQALLSLLF